MKVGKLAMQNSHDSSLWDGKYFVHLAENMLVQFLWIACSETLFCFFGQLTRRST
jgi:hypothetical protein